VDLLISALQDRIFDLPFSQRTEIDARRSLDAYCSKNLIISHHVNAGLTFLDFTVPNLGTVIQHVAQKEKKFHPQNEKCFLTK